MLAYFQHQGASYQWMLWRPGQKQASLFLETRGEPQNIFWDRSAKRVYYTLDGKIFQAHWDSLPGQSEQIAALPVNAGKLRGLWRERSTRRLRLVAMQAVATADVLTRGGLRYRLPGGRSIAATGLPPWGVPFVCTVLELDGDASRWTVLAQRATKDLAGDTPGISVVDDVRHEWGASSDGLLASYTCGAGQCRAEVPVRLIKLAETQAQQKLNADEMSMLPANSARAAVLFDTASGDQLHMVAPVFLIAADGRATLVARKHERKQLGLAIEQGYLLLADELTGARPVVIELRTGVVRFQPEGWGAVWLPR